MNKNYYKLCIQKIASESTMTSLSAYDKRINKIISSAQSNSVLEINYVDKKGIKTKRLVEPYKLTSDDFWGYDIQKECIRRFKTKNIKGVKTTNKLFDARWPIEV